MSSSDIATPGFQSSELLANLQDALQNGLSAEDKAKLLKQVNGIFEFVIKNSEGKEQIFTIDLRKDGEGALYKGKIKVKPSVSITIKDNDFIDLASGKLNGQKAYMTGKLKARGQLMLAMKLDSVFKQVIDTQVNKAKL
ncbi:SCP2 sterol-binding domain-containing protein [Umbelopsis sp. PMI_123]|nr:SCP2 sterol-binding domain-containing protein [Umbelopsis sp. PMI_123]